MCHFNLSHISIVKLYLYVFSWPASSSDQCTTCGPASLPKLYCTFPAAISLQSNAQDVDGSSDAAATRESSVALDLEVAMAVIVMVEVDGGDGYVIREETDGCGVDDDQKKDQGGSRLPGDQYRLRERMRSSSTC